ncbi:MULTISPECIES: EAL domain-containing protein [unclassified Halomonas]|uniref:EAL domain-containing protein n=1 Tax=unclassified Halomonas TaxID=2609666 RepID=UPI001C981290|nr:MULTISPECIES: EAL domain-containing protein [unclassified Halomonas]MBY5925303.1 EAL domain-containing protein [Halomonas sp. DP4Y7-2]MBY6232344.1 EAL domain-containing protein [Halomonas sp. DP4Y7-1]
MPPLFISYPQVAQAIQGEHIPWLVVLSCLVALVSVYSAMAVAERVNASRWKHRRQIWWLAGGTMMGLGIWSMHFTGMLAYRLPFPAHHSLGLTLVSLLPAIAAGLIAVAAMARKGLSTVHKVVAGCILSAGIATMHYTGMAAMQLPASMRFSPTPLILSLLISLPFGIASIHCFHAARDLPRFHGIRLGSLIAATLASLAICSMHYSAMMAVHFLPEPGWEAIPHSAGHDAIVAIAVIVLASLFALTALASVLVDRKLQDSAARMQVSRRQLVDVIESMHDGVVLLDQRARMVMCNHAFETLTGVPHTDLQGHSLLRLNTLLRFDHYRGNILRSLKENGAWIGDVEVRHRAGHRFPARLSINRVRAEEDSAGHFVATLSDTTAHHNAQQRIRYQAYHDALTTLPNRSSLQERIHALQLASDVSGRHIMLLLVDIDNFKGINDALGQATGDRLLKALAARLKPWARQPSDLARLSSNEFALLYDGLSVTPESAMDQARSKARQVLESLNGDYSLAGERHSCHVSGGFLLFRGGELGVGELLKRAGLALLESKCEGVQRPCAFEACMVERLDARLRLERQLKTAVEEDQLRLHMQPQVDDLGNILGAEMLLRWEHPERGLISPSTFISLAEETGQIVDLGNWVLHQTCQLLAEWQQHEHRRHWTLSVNVSAREFQRADFVSGVKAALAKTGAPARQLTLELTESLMLGEAYPVIDTLGQLRDLGVRFAIDDFGTGYSSLAYLKRLPLDTLKIDVAFVRDLTEDPTAAPIAQTIIALAQTLKLGVIAEGVETTAQQERLLELGCRSFQGYLYSAPLPLKQFLALATRPCLPMTEPAPSQQ